MGAPAGNTQGGVQSKQMAGGYTPAGAGTSRPMDPRLTHYTNQADLDAAMAAWNAPGGGGFGGGGNTGGTLPPRGGTQTPTTPVVPPTPGPSYTSTPLTSVPYTQAGATPVQADPNTLPGQVQGAYEGGLDLYGQMGQQGQGILGNATGYGQQAGGIYGDMAGLGAPTPVTAGQLANTDLSPYMSPYTQQVIDRSMLGLDKQQGVQQQAIDDAAARQNAFGGDRQYLQKGVLGGEFGRVKGDLMANLYEKNFLNAQQMGQFDIGQRSQADQFNNTMQGNLYGSGAQGLAGLFQTGGALGANLSNQSAAGQADMAGAGFQMANTSNANAATAGLAAQQQQQASIDAANAQLAQMLGIPQSYLQAMLGISSGMGNAGTSVGSSSTQQQPGALSIAGGITSSLGTLAGMPVG